jgi:hypothetical protein
VAARAQIARVSAATDMASSLRERHSVVSRGLLDLGAKAGVMLTLGSTFCSAATHERSMVSAARVGVVIDAHG